MATREYTYDYAGSTIRVAVRPTGATHEPRVRWEVGDQHGEAGYVYLDTTEPVVRLEDGETVAFDGAVVGAFPIERRLGQRLRAECERRGRVVSTADGLGTDPAAFPAAIAGFERVGWEADRHVMWYLRAGYSTPRAYQIECGELVFRAQEWAEGRLSRQAVVDRYGLAVAP